MKEERLQKALAHAGLGSRRQIEEMIREGRVTVNGRVASVGDRTDLERDAVKVDGKLVTPPAARRHLLVNKPRGVVSTTSDPEGRRTVLDLLPAGARRGLKPVGRLDYDSEGLLLLTDDGDLAHRVAHPSHGCPKTYEVKVRGEPDDRVIDKLRRGIVLAGRRTRPAEIQPFDGPRGTRERTANSWWRVRLSEGRTRQIRDMFQRVGHPVQRLRRVAIGTVADPHLAPGEFRDLRPQELDALREGARPGELRAPAGRRRGLSKPRGAGSRGRSARGQAGESQGKGRVGGPRRGRGRGGGKRGR
ncbi:MAG: pseudouridine synthase [Acidobacteriota bacterium]